MQRILTPTKWESEPLDAETVSSFVASMRRYSDKKQVGAMCGIPSEQLAMDWAGGLDPLRHLFFRDAASKALLPRYGYDVDSWKRIVRGYCQWHDVSHIDQLVQLWCDIIDGFLCCESYESRAPPEFRAWAYSCMCKFVLEKRKRDREAKSLVEYDPEQPYITKK